ncbi:FadR/GntR family transcriptional regulator [Domibacillus indicus]|uniref:FadR/GntR family transcriptional regulator n=1 Tax=Domibacillus indicus TaxID=1437523 RepID=UPI000617DEE2|nr:FadR/GntR family transcriptional regulator [Domibacillus indicus]
MNDVIFNELQTTRIYEKIVLQIRNLIKEGKLKPGDRLPAERELAKILGCSRTSLREACRVLESEGLIVSKPGGGRFIQKVDERVPGNARFNPVEILEKSAVMHFIEAREALEPRIADLASERAEDKDIVKMEAALKVLEEKLKNPEEKVEADSNFHLALAEATQNFVFVSLMETNLSMYRPVRKQTLQSEARYEQSLGEHRAILEAVKRKDRQAAVEAMKVHLQRIRENILKERE